MQLPQIIEREGVRVLTTKQIAKEYEVKEQQINQNFKNNRTKFIEGKHYILLSGDELKEFKKHFEKIEVVSGRASHLYLWTEKGTLLHAKSLNTDKAWEVYDYLVDFYFRQQEVKKVEEKKDTKEIVPVNQSTRKIPDAIEKKEEPPANNMFRGARVAKGMRTDIGNEKEARELMETMRKHLVGMETLLEIYSMYLDEEAFKKVGCTIKLTGDRISKFAWALSRYEPRLVEKYL